MFPVVQATISEMPKPISVLNNGPAKQAVTAVSAIPSLAIAGFAQKSPAEFPQASIVSPNMLIGRFSRIPNKDNKFIIISQILQIQSTDIIKETIVNSQL